LESNFNAETRRRGKSLLKKARFKRFLSLLGGLIVGVFLMGKATVSLNPYHSDGRELGRGLEFGAIAAAHLWVLIVGASFWFLRGERRQFLTGLWFVLLAVILTIDFQSARGY
jgi:hypothetical protein